MTRFQLHWCPLVLRVLISTAMAVLIAGCVVQGQHSDGARMETREVDVMERFVDRSITVSGHEYRYVLYVPPLVHPQSATPPNNSGRRSPLVVFLHGSGECGTDNKKQTKVGLAPAIVRAPDAWPCVVVFPQKPTQESAWEDHDQAVLAMVEAAQKEFTVDEKRLYLTGLSQGGHGSWEIGARHPEMWAAVAPLCGYGDAASFASRWTNTPVWAFHGLKDRAVPPSKTGDVIAAMNAAGHGVTYTTYADLDHNCWDRAYRDPALAQWLFAQHRP